MEPVTKDFGCRLDSADMCSLSLKTSMDLNGDERRTDDKSVCAVARRVLALEQKTEQFGKELAENTRVTKQIADDTAVLIELVQAGRKAGKFTLLMGRAFGWCYRLLVKWVLPLAVAVAAIWASLRTGKNA